MLGPRWECHRGRVPCILEHSSAVILDSMIGSNQIMQVFFRIYKMINRLGILFFGSGVFLGGRVGA
jgi:hypothetical protein